MGELTYAVVTPARDEAANLHRLAQALEQQTTLPLHWVIVDAGSTDDTLGVARQLAARQPWISVVQAPGDSEARPGAPVVRAFHAGLASVDARADVIVKLDADVSFASRYFELLLDEFARTAQLGIASGICCEQQDGRWRPMDDGGRPRGASRAYRRKCLAALVPFPESMGWDGLDELKAAADGWTARAVDGAFFFHHRAEGARDRGRFRRAIAQGEGAHFMGYRFTYLLARAAFRASRDPAAAAMVWGYMSAALRRRPRYENEAARRLLRRRQSIRSLVAAARARL